MPLTRVSLLKGKPPEYRQAILAGLYQAIREVFDVPEDDRFMLIDEYDKSNFAYGENYLGIARDDDLVIVQITVNNTRGPDKKKALYARIAELLAKNPGIRVVWQRHRAICVSGEAPLQRGTGGQVRAGIPPGAQP
jgi:4-oxalocrotonate tautomerase